LIHIENVSEIYTPRNLMIWLISAFKSGFINSVGLLMTGKFVSHVTGFGTQIGMAVGHEDFFFGAELLIIPVSFIGGGVLTSYILENRKSPEEIPTYHLVQGLITLLLGAILLLVESGVVSSKESFDLDNNYNFIEFMIIGILCLVCGLKNALTTWSSFGKIRVTHLTGISTDIGLNLLRTFNPKFPTSRFKEERIVNLSRILIFFCFSLGAYLSAVTFSVVGYKAFYLIFSLSLFMSVISFLDHQKLKEGQAEFLSRV